MPPDWLTFFRLPVSLKLKGGEVIEHHSSSLIFNFCLGSGFGRLRFFGRRFLVGIDSVVTGSRGFGDLVDLVKVKIDTDFASPESLTITSKICYIGLYSF